MKTLTLCALFATLLLNLPCVDAQGTAFTYQGQLNSNGVLANGSYDFTFRLFNSSSTNTGQVGSSMTNLGVGVTNGLFTVILDFGANFPGASRWLAIGVRPAGGGSFTALNPLQELTPTPYAIYAPSSGTAASANSVAAADVTGQILSSTLPSNPSVSGTVTASGFSGNGSGLTSLNATQLTSGTVADARLSTNVDLLNGTQALTGAKTFSNSIVVSPGNGTLMITNDNGIVPGIVANGGNAPGHVRFRNGLEVWPDNGASNSGYLDVRNTNGLATIVLNGAVGSVTASNFNGNGSGLINLNASDLTNGTIADARLSTNVPLLNKSQTFTGLNQFNDGIFVLPSSGDLALWVEQSSTGGFGQPVAEIQNTSTAANASPALRLSAAGNTGNGVLSVSSSGTGLIAQFGNSSSFVSQLDTSGNWTANSFSGNGSGLTSVNAITLGGSDLAAVTGTGLSFGSNAYLNNNPLYLRNDMKDGLGYNGGGITNFPSAAVQPDGPVLWGFTGGALGVLNGGAQAALSWNNTNVSISSALNVAGNLSANNTPGVNYSQSGNQINIPNNGAVQIDACGNAKHAAGYFVIVAFASIYSNGNDVWLSLYDTTSGNNLLITSESDPPGGSGIVCISISCVQPITSVGGFENYAVTANSSGNGSIVNIHNLTVMYFPRSNAN